MENKVLTALTFFLPLYVVGTFPLSALAQQRVLPWLESIGAQERLSETHTLSAEATVVVSDGLMYTVKTVFHDRQRAVFRRVYADHTITQGVEGRYIWEYDGMVEREASSFVEELVLGHQFHAQLLFLDQLHPTVRLVRAEQFNGQACMALVSEEEAYPWRFYYSFSGRPLGMERMRREEGAITFIFDDWRTVSEMLLPFEVRIDDGERQFIYRYSSIRINEGTLSAFRASEEVLTEEQQLLRLHRVVMDGHLFGQTAEMKSIRSDTLLIVSDGDIYMMEGAESDAMLDRMIASRDYTVYDDLVRPIVHISEDGSLGWVIAQVAASGVRYDSNGAPSSPLEFVSAWIELYEKVDDQWRLTGNVSNFRSGRQ